jgi:hypothetical protein
MEHNGRTRDGVWLYVIRRVWWRLIAALYRNRRKLLGVVIALFALGLWSLCGASESYAALVGSMPMVVNVQRLDTESKSKQAAGGTETPSARETRVIHPVRD